MLSSETNSQVLSADGETPIRLVTINGIPFWQASGRTFPVVAGAEDPPPGDADNDKDKDGDGDFDKDRALATIKKLRDTEKTAKSELKTLKERLEALEGEKRQRDDADKSEVEKLTAKVNELATAHTEAQQKAAAAEARLKAVQVDRAIEQAAQKHGARNPSVVAKLLDRESLEFDDDGEPTNAEELIKDLLKAEPYLMGSDTNGGASGGRPGVPPTPRSSGQPKREEKIKENEEKLIATRQYTPF